MEFLVLCIVIGWIWNNWNEENRERAKRRQKLAETHPGYMDVLIG